VPISWNRCDWRYQGKRIWPEPAVRRCFVGLKNVLAQAKAGVKEGLIVLVGSIKILNKADSYKLNAPAAAKIPSITAAYASALKSAMQWFCPNSACPATVYSLASLTR
jgi:hypothetical protein